MCTRIGVVTVALFVVGGCGGGSSKQGGDDLGGGAADMAMASGDLASSDLASGGNSPVEVEPNNGASLTDRNDTAFGAAKAGAIGSADDVDVFFVDVAPGQLVTATLAADASSTLQPHLTVIDAGRGGDDAGQDYVKIVKSSSLTTSLAMQWVAMGQGGYLVVVRDVRNVDGAGGVGSADHRYSLTLTKSAPVTTPIAGGASGTGTLANAGAVVAYELDVAAAGDLVFDVKKTGGATGIDGRVLVYAASELDWVARQDDRSASDTNPLVDAPLGTTGKHWLVVENIEPAATSFGFSYSLAFP